MLESMTGTARHRVKIESIQFHFSLKSVNNRFLESIFALPPGLAFMEEEFRSLLSREITRGRVDVEIAMDASFGKPEVDRSLFDGYLTLLTDEGVVGRFSREESPASKKRAKSRSRKGGGTEKGDSVSSLPAPGGGFSGGENVSNRETALTDPSLRLRLLQLPGVLTLSHTLPSGFPLDQLKEAFVVAVHKLHQSRLKEGGKIERIFKGYLNSIRRERKKIEQRLVRFRREMTDLFKSDLTPLLPDGNREEWNTLLPRVLEWHDRYSVTEEVERLEMHLQAVESLMEEGVDAGKRIEFFTQEMIREANTIASKSRDFSIRRHVVEIKMYIEKIKEQVRNIC